MEHSELETEPGTSTSTEPSTPTTMTRQAAGLIQSTLRRLGWDDSLLDYQSPSGVWTEENIDYDQNRLAVFRLRVRVRYNPNVIRLYQAVNPVAVQAILSNPSLSAVDKVGRIFTLCGGTDWTAYTELLIGANTNTFLAGLLAG